MPHVDDRLYLLGVDLNFLLKNEEPEELFRSHPEGALSRIQPHPTSSKSVKSFFEILDMI